MKNIFSGVFILSILFFSAACRQKSNKKKETENFIPVISFIRSDVEHVDTSLYSIRKVTFLDGAKTDTVYFRREQFRELASEFLTLPDLSGPEYKDRFVEEKRYDENLNKVIIDYLPKDPQKEDIQRQEILIDPDDGDKVTSVIIDFIKNNRDSSIEKRMLWQINKSFQVATTRQLPGQPETIKTYKVIWNDENQEYNEE